MSWRISEREFLIRGKSYHIYLSLSVNRVRLPDGTLINSANEYFRVSAGGEVLQRYGDPLTCSVEDYLYVSGIHAVVQSSLYKFLWIERFGHDSKLEGEVCLRGLEPVAEGVLPFDAAQVVEGFHERRGG
jgi:hypothetical protein